MTNTILLKIILTISVCHSFPMIRAHINAHSFLDDNPQRQVTKAIQNIGQVFNEHCYTSHQVPTEDDQASFEVSKQLKDIENALMEDTDAEIHYLNNYSSHTSSWKQTYEELNAMIGTKDAENNMELSNPKRKSKMSTSRYFQSPDFSFKDNQRDSTFELDCQGFDPLSLKPDSQYLGISQPGGQTHKELVISIQSDEHRAKPKPSSRPHFENSETFDVSQQSIDTLSSVPQGLDSNLISLMIWKGQIAMWYNPQVSNQMGLFFDRIDKGVYSCLKRSQFSYYSPDEVDYAVTRIQSDVVMGFLGALNILFQGKKNKPKMRNLIASGWDFLQKALHKAFDPLNAALNHLDVYENQSHHDYFLDPSLLLHYILQLKPKSYISSTLIRHLIEDWSGTTIYNPKDYQIDISPSSFLSTIQSQVALRGPIKTIWNDQNKFSSKQMNNSGSKTEKALALDKIKLKRAIAKNPAKHLERIGVNEMLNYKGLLLEVIKFFEWLKQGMIENLDKDKMLINADMKTKTHPNLVIMHPRMIHNLISLVHSRIMPAFLGILILLNRDQDGDQVIEQLLRTGWNTLQAYIERWKEVLLVDKTSIILPETGKAAHFIKWYDSRESLHYLCQRKQMSSLPAEPLWFLVELWYEEMTEKSVRGESLLGFQPSPPTRDVYNHILSHLEKKGLTDSQRYFSKGLKCLPKPNTKNFQDEAPDL
ncbi:hypothetical protein DFH28DRAFT_177518 [Melampsora americana]|nr:hypothetical protein DFH28DRAFT_177518 [Melampsora americana]